MASFSLTEAERAARGGFQEEAWRQRECAVSKDRRDFADGRKNWEAHHVVEARWLKGHGHRDKLYDRRNAIRLTPDVHRRHTNRMEPIPLLALTDDNIEFAFEVMGVLALEYLTRLYTGTDARVQRAFEVAELQYSQRPQ